MSGEYLDIDFSEACEGCPASTEELNITDETEQCQFYAKYTTYVDGRTVKVVHHECHNVEMLGQLCGAGILEASQIDPLTGVKIN